MNGLKDADHKISPAQINHVYSIHFSWCL